MEGCMGEESFQMWELNRRLEVYLSRVKALEEQNELLNAELSGLRARSGDASWRTRADDELAALRALVDQHWREKHAAEVERDNLAEELEGVAGRCLQLRLARERNAEEAACSRRAAEAQQSAQGWLSTQVAELERELEVLRAAHEEERAHLHAQAACAPSEPPALPRGPRVPTPEVEELARRLGDAWRGAVRGYQERVAHMESSLGQAREQLGRAVQGSRETRRELQQLLAERDGLQERREALQQRLENCWQDRLRATEKFQLAVEALEQEKQGLQSQIAQVLEGRQQLAHLKMSLSLEVATYRTLLEAENSRLQIPGGGSQASLGCQDPRLQLHFLGTPEGRRLGPVLPVLSQMPLPSPLPNTLKTPEPGFLKTQEFLQARSPTLASTPIPPTPQAPCSATDAEVRAQVASLPLLQTQGGRPQIPEPLWAEAKVVSGLPGLQEPGSKQLEASISHFPEDQASLVTFLSSDHPTLEAKDGESDAKNASRVSIILQEDEGQILELVEKEAAIEVKVESSLGQETQEEGGLYMEEIHSSQGPLEKEILKAMGDEPLISLTIQGHETPGKETLKSLSSVEENLETLKSLEKVKQTLLKPLEEKNEEAERILEKEVPEPPNPLGKENLRIMKQELVTSSEGTLETIPFLGKENKQVENSPDEEKIESFKMESQHLLRYQEAVDQETLSSPAAKEDKESLRALEDRNQETLRPPTKEDWESLRALEDGGQVPFKPLEKESQEPLESAEEEDQRIVEPIEKVNRESLEPLEEDQVIERLLQKENQESLKSLEEDHQVMEKPLEKENQESLTSLEKEQFIVESLEEKNQESLKSLEGEEQVFEKSLEEENQESLRSLEEDHQVIERLLEKENQEPLTSLEKEQVIVESLEEKHQESLKSLEGEEQVFEKSLEEENQESLRSLEEDYQVIERLLEKENQEPLTSLEKEQVIVESLEEKNQEPLRSLEGEEQVIEKSLEENQECLRSLERENQEPLRYLTEEEEVIDRPLEEENQESLTSLEKERVIVESLEEKNQESLRSLEGETQVIVEPLEKVNRESLEPLEEVQVIGRLLEKENQEPLRSLEGEEQVIEKSLTEENQESLRSQEEDHQVIERPREKENQESLTSLEKEQVIVESLEEKNQESLRSLEGEQVIQKSLEEENQESLSSLEEDHQVIERLLEKEDLVSLKPVEGESQETFRSLKKENQKSSRSLEQDQEIQRSPEQETQQILRVEGKEDQMARGSPEKANSELRKTLRNDQEKVSCLEKENQELLMSLKERNIETVKSLETQDLELSKTVEEKDLEILTSLNAQEPLWSQGEMNRETMNLRENEIQKSLGYVEKNEKTPSSLEKENQDLRSLVKWALETVQSPEVPEKESQQHLEVEEDLEVAGNLDLPRSPDEQEQELPQSAHQLRWKDVVVEDQELGQDLPLGRAGVDSEDQEEAKEQGELWLDASGEAWRPGSPEPKEKRVLAEEASRKEGQSEQMGVPGLSTDQGKPGVTEPLLENEDMAGDDQASLEVTLGSEAAKGQSATGAGPEWKQEVVGFGDPGHLVREEVIQTTLGKAHLEAERAQDLEGPGKDLKEAKLEWPKTSRDPLEPLKCCEVPEPVASWGAEETLAEEISDHDSPQPRPPETEEEEVTETELELPDPRHTEAHSLTLVLEDDCRPQPRAEGSQEAGWGLEGRAETLGGIEAEHQFCPGEFPEALQEGEESKEESEADELGETLPDSTPLGLYLRSPASPMWDLAAQQSLSPQGEARKEGWDPAVLAPRGLKAPLSDEDVEKEQGHDSDLSEEFEDLGTEPSLLSGIPREVAGPLDQVPSLLEPACWDQGRESDGFADEEESGEEGEEEELEAGMEPGAQWRGPGLSVGGLKAQDYSQREDLLECEVVGTSGPSDDSLRGAVADVSVTAPETKSQNSAEPSGSISLETENQAPGQEVKSMGPGAGNTFGVNGQDPNLKESEYVNGRVVNGLELSEGQETQGALDGDQDQGLSLQEEEENAPKTPWVGSPVHLGPSQFLKFSLREADRDSWSSGED